MNASVLKEGNNGAYAVTIVGVIAAGVFSYWVSLSSSQTSELREHDQAISQLKASDLNHQANDERTSKAIAEIQSAQSLILGSQTNQKDSIDEVNRRLEGLQKSFDGVNDILRPARAPSGR
jgi:chromosome segregation ATPase